MSGSLAMGGCKITDLADRIWNQDVTTKNYQDGQSDLRLAKIYGIMSGNLVISGNRIICLALHRYMMRPTITMTILKDLHAKIKSKSIIISAAFAIYQSYDVTFDLITCRYR